MIAATDSITLTPGVSLERGRLADAVRGDSWPLNASGVFVLTRAGTPVGAVVRELAEAFSLTAGQARADVLQFVWHLNRLALVNVERRASRVRQLASWLSLAARLAPAGTLPAPVSRRRALDTGSVFRALVSALRAVLPRSFLVGGVATVLIIQPALLVGAGTAASVLLGAATGLGLGLHEAAHAMLLRGVPSAFVCRGRRTYVLHAPVGSYRRLAVAICGPLAVSVLGVGLVAAGGALTAPVLAVAGLPLAAHALSLTVVGGDGRVACGL
jgi:hypothetical protein